MAEKVLFAPGPVFTTRTDFMINKDGNVGIGTALPDVKLHISCPPLTESNDLFNNIVFKITDPGNNLFLGITNRSENGIAAGALILNVVPEEKAGLLILKSSGDFAALGVTGLGTMGLNMDLALNPVPIAQLDIRKNNIYNEVVNISDQYLSPVFQIKNNGNTGIGIAPVAGTTLTIKDTSTNTRLDLIPSNNGAGINSIRFMRNTTLVRHIITESNGDLLIDPGVASGGGNNLLKVDGNLRVTQDLTVDGVMHFTNKVTVGNVTIPTTSCTGTDYMLLVEKGILTERVKVAVKTTSDWCDYVFDKSYKLRPLAELEQYIKANKHLPEIPSAEEVVSTGNDLGAMDAKLLKKIEELTLYVLALKKENEKQQQLIDALTKN